MTDGSSQENAMDSTDTHNGSVGAAEPSVNSGRRKFASATLAAPVLLSLVNKTAWAGPACAPSAFVSATFASHHPDQALLCGNAVGRSPGYWKNHPNAWPVPFLPDPRKRRNQECSDFENTQGDDEFYVDGSSPQNHTYCRSTSLFNEVFDCVGTSPYPDNWTLMEVLRNGNGNAGMQNVEFHAVAALLNAASGQPDYNLTVAEVLTIFCDLINFGCHTISTGLEVCWDDDPNGVGWTFKQYFDNYQ